MPIFTFTCGEHEFESLVISTVTKIKCPLCGHEARRSIDFELVARRNPAHGIQTNMDTDA